MHERYLSLKDADNEQSTFANEIMNLDKGVQPVGRSIFFNTVGLCLSAREKVLKAKYFQ